MTITRFCLDNHPKYLRNCLVSSLYSNYIHCARATQDRVIIRGYDRTAYHLKAFNVCLFRSWTWLLRSLLGARHTAETLSLYKIGTLDWESSGPMQSLESTILDCRLSANCPQESVWTNGSEEVSRRETKSVFQTGRVRDQESVVALKWSGARPGERLVT